MAKIRGKEYVAVVDRGTFRVFQKLSSPSGRSPRLELIDEWRPVEAHAKLSEQLTDAAGRFPSGQALGAAGGDLSQGERHGIKQEIDRRLVRRMAERLSRLLQAERADRCDLAVSAPIHHQFLDAVKQGVRGVITRVLPSDLSRIPVNQILEHFDRAA